ncbi:MAG TPA: hypothetical protein VKB38_14875 [Terracidiphilus sp.]|nr:hypothetical protein [Terracidiphilus sp.]
MKSPARIASSTALRRAVAGLLLCLPAIAFCSNPTAVSVTPASGAGTVQSFALAYSDSAGVSDLSWVFALFTPNGDGAHACGVYYHPGDNLIYLADDTNTTVLGPGAVGQPGTLSNSQCKIDVGASSTSTSVIGNTLTLNLVVHFKFFGTFIGPTSVYMYAEDNESNNSGFVKRGSWTVESVAPTGVSVSPSAGSGPSQTFALTYYDGNGTADLRWVYAYLATSGTADATNTCYFFYHPSDNLIYLSNDTGGSWGPGAVGQAGTLTNGQCTLDVGASSVSHTLNTLTLNVALSFEGKPANSYGIYLFANGGPQQNLGTFTVTSPPFYAVSATTACGPSCHSSSNQNTFNVEFSDANGGSAIDFAYVLFSPNNDGTNACAVYFEHMLGWHVYLANDANDAVVGPGQIGSPGTLSNSQCTVDAGNASATAGGTTLQIILPVTFASTFYGPLNIITYAEDNAGENTGFHTTGTYAVSAPVAPTYVYGTQNGVVAPTVYTRYADASGSQDLRTLYVMVGPSLNLTASCQVRYEKGNNTIFLSDDAGGWRGPGQPSLSVPGQFTAGVAGSLSNNECTVNTGNSASSEPGDYSDPFDWDLNVPITHYSAPSGTVLNIYMNAVDNEGLSAGWVQMSTWTVP